MNALGVVASRRMILVARGKNGRAAIVEKLTQVAQGGALNVQKDNITLYDPKEIRQALESVLEQALQNVANQSLLVA